MLKRKCGPIIIASVICLTSSFAVFADPLVDVTQSDSQQQPLVQTGGQQQVTAPVVDTSNMSTDERLSRLEQIVAAQNQIQLLNRVNQLQQQVEVLSGQNDMLRYQIQQLQTQQRQFYTDLDQRISALESGTKVAPKATAAIASSAMPATSDQDTYQQAYNFITGRQYDQAVTALAAFVKQYPKSAYVPNALYWQGQVLAMQSKNADAQKLFTQLLTQYPNDAKVPDAKLKLALMSADNNQLPIARQQLQDIIKQYPNSSAATLAANKLRQLKGT
jgi:tol-pal system protein YbgF